MSKTLICCATIWLAGVGYGLYALVHYSASASPASSALETWPEHSQIVRKTGQSTLLMFVHPKCPCSSASLAELSRAVVGSNSRTTIYVIFYEPGKRPEGWGQSDLLKQASRIPGVNVILDRDNAEALLFHVDTSGHTLFYDSEGHLLFSGGITYLRGHEGDNAGRDAVASLVGGGNTAQTRWPVFGCSLISSNAKMIAENHATN